VVGVPDRRMGEVGLAVVVPATPGAVDRIVAELPGWAVERLANYKVSRMGVQIVDALPVNASGKVLKRELRDRYAAPSDEAHDQQK
jgi:HIP---CoA ligase